MDKYIGRLLENRYELLEEIGRGGMSTVYKARDHRLDRLVAVKILKEDLAQDEEFRRRFHDESRAVAMLSHPNIVAVYDVSRSTDIDFIVMELIEGITLKQYMQQKGNKLNWREALHFIIQITKALSHAHSRGIIHRDIKPHNIMVLRDGSAKVADFGIARLINAGHSTLTQEALGSVHYISPEQARGSHVDARSDIYSAGVVLYEMLTGRLPFEGDSPVSVAIQHINSIPLSPREIDPSLPEALEAITMKAMAPNPDRRYLSADDMLADLEEFRKNPDINFDYEFPTLDVDDEPTQIKSVSHSAPEHRSRRISYDEPDDGGRDFLPEEDEEEDERPSRSRSSGRSRSRTASYPFAVAVILILVFVGVLFFFLWRTFLGPLLFPTDPTYTVPSVTGHTLQDFALDPSLLDGFELNPEVIYEESDEEVGVIVEQDPAANTQVKGEDNRVITVTVSTGRDVLTMPEIYNQEYRSAMALLDQMGLKILEPIREYSDTINSGYVTRYTPEYGSTVIPGETEVQIWVSEGKETVEVEVPSVLGETRENALGDLAIKNLKGEVVAEVYDPEIPEGCVVAQYPDAGTSVAEDSTVNLQISKGPDPADTPPEEEPTPGTPGTSAEPTDSNPPEPPASPPPAQVTGTKEIIIELPDVTGFVDVKVTLDDVVVREEQVDCTEEMLLNWAITGTGVQRLAIYFDGMLSTAYDVDFTS